LIVGFPTGRVLHFRKMNEMSAKIRNR